MKITTLPNDKTAVEVTNLLNQLSVTLSREDILAITKYAIQEHVVEVTLDVEDTFLEHRELHHYDYDIKLVEKKEPVIGFRLQSSALHYTNDFEKAVYIIKRVDGEDQGAYLMTEEDIRNLIDEHGSLDDLIEAFNIVKGK